MSNGQYASLIHNAQASSNAVAGLFNNTVSKNLSTYTQGLHNAFSKNLAAYNKMVNANNLTHQDNKLFGQKTNSDPWSLRSVVTESGPMGSANHAAFNGLKSGLHDLGSGLHAVGHGLHWLVNQFTNTN